MELRLGLYSSFDLRAILMVVLCVSQGALWMLFIMWGLCLKTVGFLVLSLR